MKICVFDIEANGLDPDRIWVLSAAVYSMGKWRIKSTSDYDEMRGFFSGADVLVGHNIKRFDIPVVERILGIEIKSKLKDTLGISWYLYPDRIRHGLEFWGEDFGIKKPKIEEGEWLGPLEGETFDEFMIKMTHRCEEDVKINCSLWDKQLRDLYNLYDDNEKQVNRIMDYIMFKLDCALEAEESKWKLDVERTKEELSNLRALKKKKMEELKEAMPLSITYQTMERPDNLYTAGTKRLKPATYFKVDGTLSSAGERYKKECEVQGLDPETTEEIIIPSNTLTQRAIKWLDLLESLNLPESHKDPIEYVSSSEKGNPNSVSQVKDWLYSLGWKPINFSYVGDRSIPQVRIDEGGGKTLCPSVKKLFAKEPSLEALEGLTVLTHRIGILKGYLKNVNEEGYLQAEISGLTNTLRFKHSVIVNLPAANKPYGDIVRGVLVAPEGYELCGSDMSSLEDRTKQHYMWKHDPDYVKEMQTPDFDPHLALAQFAGALTPEEVKSHKKYSYYKNLYKNAAEAGEEEDAKEFMALYQAEQDFSQERHLYKTANYSCTYGAGGKKLSLTLDIPESEGHAIVKAYRDKNWAINAIAEDCLTKQSLGTMWLWNPVSRFWYSLRHKKDRFSTLNQGTGVYCFDIWIANFRKQGIKLTGQMHDEIITCVKKGRREEVEKILQDAIVLTNKQLKLNRELGIDVQFGDNYAEIH
jgi:hypothetical protein